MLKKQVIIIHGGDSFPTYEEYLSFLNNFELKDLDRYRKRNWKGNLQDDLGDDYDVVCPKMPNKDNAKYAEWKIWFDKIVNLANQKIIIVGHSMGGIFLAKYLSLNQIGKQIIATFLVGAPYDTDGGRKIVEFDLPKSLRGFEKQGGNIYIYHSEDDPIVGFEELDKYQKVLKTARIKLFKDRGHFIGPQIPELIRDIKNL